MGYTTTFDGSFDVSPPLEERHRLYLSAFCETRRMARNAKITATRPDPLRHAVGLPVGAGGDFFVGETGYAGQDNGPDVIDHNNPPRGQPGLWCKWTPTEDGAFIEWSGAEKFYDYVEWLQYLVDYFLTPWGYALTGTVTWQGEETGDVGRIVAESAGPGAGSKIVWDA